VVSAANPATTHPGVVELLRGLDVAVYTGGDLEDRHLQALEHEPTLIVDSGFELCAAAARAGLPVRGAVEMSRSGIRRLREGAGVPFPVINVNDGRLKNAVENRHGVPEAIWQAVTQLTGLHLAGREVVVIGYGPVGKGIATHARALGMCVDVIEADPIRRLYAHYDGFRTPSQADAVRRARFVVTATGVGRVLTLDQLADARDGVILLNAGHGGDEIEVQAIRRAAATEDQVGPRVIRYTMDDGRRITILADGQPLNLVLNAGSPETVLLHFAVLGMALEWLGTQTRDGAGLPPGEHVVLEALERDASRLALEAHDAAGR